MDNVELNHTISEYKKKYHNRTYKLCAVSKKKVDDFDKKFKFNDKHLLGKHSWWLIGDVYYQVPTILSLTWLCNIISIVVVNLGFGKGYEKQLLEEFTAPLKKSKIFKHKKPKTFYGYRTGKTVEMKKGTKPVIKLKRKLLNILYGIRYDKDGVEVRQNLRSRLKKFAMKRGKKTVKKKFKTQIKNLWNSLSGVSKVTVISIGGIGITASVAIPTVLANTIWKADKYEVEIDSGHSSYVTVTKQDSDTNGNLIFKLNLNKPDSVITGISSVKKGDYTLAYQEGATTFEEKKHEYTFDLTENKLKVYKNVIGTHKGNIVITPILTDSATINKIEINTTSSKHKSSFSVNDTYSSAGLVLKATFSDGKISDITSGFTTNFDSHTFVKNDLGQKIVTVTYKGLNCSYDIAVEPVYEKEIIDSSTGFKYCKIQGTENWIVKWDEVTALKRVLEINSGTQEIEGETVNVIAIQTNGFKNAIFKDGTEEIQITVNGYNMQEIGAGAFNNSAINEIIIKNNYFLWNSENNNESYVFDEYGEEHSAEFPKIYAQLFRGDLKNKILFNSKRLTYSADYQSQLASVGIVSEESGNVKVLKIPALIKIGNTAFRVPYFSINDGADLSDVTDIYVPFTIENIGENTFYEARQSLRNVYFTNAYYWCDSAGEELDPELLKTPSDAANLVKEKRDEISIDYQTPTEIVYEEEGSSAIAYHTDHESNDGDDCSLYKNVFIRSEEFLSETKPVKSIKYNDNTRGAFQGCTNLESVVLPRSLTLIDVNAFKNCDHLANIYYCGTTSEWNNQSFTKKGGWHDGCPAVKVICLDGEIAL